MFDKMIMSNESRIAVRLPNDLRKKTEQLIKKGKFRSLSNIVRIALKEFLSRQGE
jgi:Arc/MetJ-type ribon-helix-helix transcriptional regulator